MRHVVYVGVSVLGLAIAVASAQTVDIGGWTTFRNTGRVCQMKAPSTWEGRTVTRTDPARRTTTVTVHAVRKSDTFETGKALIREVRPPVTVLQDDSTRLFYTFTPPAGEGTRGWQVVLNSSPVCGATVTFDAGADEALLKRIVDTLAPAK